MRYRDIAFMVLIQLIWGLNFVAIKYAVVDISPIFANALRFFIVAIMLSPFLKVVEGHMKQIISIALMLGVLHFGTVMAAVAYAGGVSEVAIVAQLSVPFSTIMAVVFLKEVIRWKRIFAIALSFVGVIVLGFDPRVFNNLDAAFLVAASALSIAIAAIWMRKLKYVPALTIQAWVGVAGFIGCLSLSFIAESGQMEQISTASTTAWLAVFYSALLSSVLGHGGINYLLTRYEVSVVSPYMLLMPVFGVGGSVLILGETLTDRMILGGIITMSGVVIITLRNRRRTMIE